MVLVGLGGLQGIKYLFDGQPTEFISTVTMMVYLSLEYYGLLKKENIIIIVGCIIRCLQLIIVFALIITILFDLETNYDRDEISAETVPNDFNNVTDLIVFERADWEHRERGLVTNVTDRASYKEFVSNFLGLAVTSEQKKMIQ